MLKQEDKVNQKTKLYACDLCGARFEFTPKNFSLCIRCARIVCRKRCLKACALCGRERCQACFEEIARAHETSGEICEKCAFMKKIAEKRERS